MSRQGRAEESLLALLGADSDDDEQYDGPPSEEESDAAVFGLPAEIESGLLSAAGVKAAFRGNASPGASAGAGSSAAGHARHSASFQPLAQEEDDLAELNQILTDPAAAAFAALKHRRTRKNTRRKTFKHRGKSQRRS